MLFTRRGNSSSSSSSSNSRSITTIVRTKYQIMINIMALSQWFFKPSPSPLLLHFLRR